MKTHLRSSLSQGFVLPENSVDIVLLGDLEESESLHEGLASRHGRVCADGGRGDPEEADMSGQHVDGMMRRARAAWRGWYVGTQVLCGNLSAASSV